MDECEDSIEVYEARFLQDQNEIQKLKNIIKENSYEETKKLENEIYKYKRDMNSMGRVIRVLRKINENQNVIMAKFMQSQSQYNKIIDEWRF